MPVFRVRRQGRYVESGTQLIAWRVFGLRQRICWTLKSTAQSQYYDELLENPTMRIPFAKVQSDCLRGLRGVAQSCSKPRYSQIRFEQLQTSISLISTYDLSTLCQRGYNDNQKKVLTKDIMIKTSSISNFFEMAHFTTTRVKMNKAVVTSSTHAIFLMAGPQLSALSCIWRKTRGDILSIPVSVSHDGRRMDALRESVL